MHSPRAVRNPPREKPVKQQKTLKLSLGLGETLETMTNPKAQLKVTNLQVEYTSYTKDHTPPRAMCISVEVY